MKVYLDKDRDWKEYSETIEVTSGDRTFESRVVIIEITNFITLHIPGDFRIK